MKKIFISFCFLLLSVCLNAQLPIENVKLFTLTTASDTIQFIKIDEDTTQTKPSLLFCQGSLPMPLIGEFEKGNFSIMATSNFDYKTLSAKYHIIIISMPNTPIVANKNQLNHQYGYVPDTSKPYHYDTEYWKNNYLEKYVERANAVLDFLRKQTWVNKNKIIVFGHSQGSHIALHVAKQNQDIYALGYFSGNVLGRFASTVLEARNDAKSGKISENEAQANIDEKYDWWKTICRDTTEFSIENSDSKRTWKSFSQTSIELLISIKTPVFIAYGTKDDGPQICDIMPIYFELAGKKNYKMRPFVGCGHNFEEITPNGNHNWDKMYWDEAVKEFILWCEDIKN